MTDTPIQPTGLRGTLDYFGNAARTGGLQGLMQALKDNPGALSVGNLKSGKRGGATQPPPFQSNAQAPGAFQPQTPDARRALIQAMVARSRAGGMAPGGANGA